MGRSKFPGKPSKHCHRKRVNVLPPNGELTNLVDTGPVTVITSQEDNKQDDEVEEKDSESASREEAKPLKRRVPRKLNSTLRKDGRKRALISKMCAKGSIKVNKATRTSNLSRNLTRKESANLAGKFVLPTRSVHSSRVIKPNKRFIELNEGLTVKKKVIAKRPIKTDEDKSKIKSTKSEDGSFSKTESDKTAYTNGHRVILRQARLKLPNQIGTQGPFSTKPHNGPGTIICGVCGAVRYYRFVKHARKFNIYSCESCRKFISKHIKRQSVGSKKSNSTLVCHKGQGTCYIPPVVRSQHWKINKCAYRSRCPACWLKMCLKTYQLTPNLKQNLTQLLPKNMRGLDFTFNNTLPPLLWQKNIENPVPVSTSPVETTTLKQRPVRFKTPKIQPTPAPATNSDIKRQKIDLKGPRVKHVCRSASIVLGQPIATFNNDVEKKCDTPDQQNDIRNATEVKPVNSSVNKNESPILSEDDTAYSEKMSKINYILNENADVSRRDRIIKNPTSVSTCTETKTTKSELDEKEKENLNLNEIYLDYSGDLNQDNNFKYGYCIIGSQPFPMTGICFLCGSGGKEPMLVCSSCCQPYHTFCVEKQISIQSTCPEEYEWTCSMCIKCSECNSAERPKIQCCRCHKFYHSDCFSPRWDTSGSEKPAVCKRCLKCNQCETVFNVKCFPGNKTFCSTCLAQKKYEMICPVCHHTVDDENCCSMMLECEMCHKWLHTKCEKLSNEQYQLVRFLPKSVKFSCKSCRKDGTQNWQSEILWEMRKGFERVLRQLGKNKTARNILKRNSSSKQTPIKSIVNMRKLHLFEKEVDIDNNNYSRDTTDMNKIYCFEENEKLEKQAQVTNTLLDIKNKLFAYNSVNKFNNDMLDALKITLSEEVLKVYKKIFQDAFPWFNQSCTEHVPDTILDTALIESQLIENAVSMSLPDIPHNSSMDSRCCVLCKQSGDELINERSRLLHCGNNEWVHANCAFWSSEVYEEIDNHLQNVQASIRKSRTQICVVCTQPGASIRCFTCSKEIYHFACARAANCYFTKCFKACFCPKHPPTGIIDNSFIIKNDKDFELRRSIFIELNFNCRPQSAIENVKYIVGSLSIKNLGKIEPIVSDNSDAIVPMGFICTRLFWSTIEPWKLVPYTITTSVQNPNCSTLTVDKNFTVDHTLNKSEVDKVLKELYLWQKEHDKKNEEIESEDEEEKNGDLLSPELTDTILEDLPHDILDGISVQDIFPNLLDMEFENIGDSLKKEEDSMDADFKNGRELPRCKSEISHISKADFPKARPAPTQRSCSLTLSCKVDSAISPTIKKRKIAGRENNINMYYQLLQVDGNFDDSSSSECNSPTDLESSNPWGSYVSEEPVTCEKCQCTYRTQASYKKHLDSCEVLCTSESDSENLPESEFQESTPNFPSDMKNSSVMVEVTDTQPVLIQAYESYQSEVHTAVVNGQSFISSSKSADVFSMPQPPEVMLQTVSTDINQKPPLLQTVPMNTVTPLSISQNTAEAPTEQAYTITQPAIALNDQQTITIPNNQFCVNQTVPICVNQPIQVSQNTIQVNPGIAQINPGLHQNSIQVNAPIINGNQMQTISINSPIPLNQINQHQPISINQPQSIDFNQTQQPVTIHSVPYNNVTPILNVASQNQFTLNGKLIQTSPLVQTVNVPGAHWVQKVNKPAVLTQKAIRSRMRSRAIAAKRPDNYEEETIILPANNSGQVIVQHLPSTNFVPFVDAFQQQTGQNVQYVATIAPQVNTVAQPIMQIQPENNIISIVPGLQPTMIIQQPRVLENQLVLDSNGTLGWSQVSQPQTVQPVYYGFETIVQNTVMQSQQFLPTTVPGVLAANSSYSTTTQVFQTSKLEPVLDVSSNSFVLLNSGQLVNSQVEVPQYSQSQPTTIMPSQTPTLVYSQSSPNAKPMTVPTSSTNSSISLPTTPFISDQGIPMNIVTPIPKPPTSQSRPMSRVLPMPTNTIKPPKKSTIHDDKKLIEEQFIKKPILHKIEEIKIQPQKESMKQLDSIAKIKPKKIEILENKIIKSPPQIPKLIKIEQKSPGEFEPVEKIPKLELPTLDEFFEPEKLKSPIKENIEERKISPSLLFELKRTEEKMKLNKIEVEQIVKKQLDKMESISRTLEKVEEIKETNKLEEPVAPPISKEVLDEGLPKEDASLKLVFQKQSDDGTYKVSNNCSKQPVVVSPLRPVKTENCSTKEEEKQIKSETKIPPDTSVPKQSIKKDNESGPSILYTVKTDEGFKYSSNSVSDCWVKVLEAVQNARAAHNMPPLPTSNSKQMKSIQLLGLKSNHLKYLIEQLPGASKCTKYKPLFAFPPHPFDVGESTDHVFGAIRCRPLGDKNEEPYDMFGWLSSKHRQPFNISMDLQMLQSRRATNLPMSMKFRNLKITSKYSVGVYRSNIHGRGLFCLRDIEAGEMVIEYAGEVIRSILTDKREKEYNSKGIGCYMFRVDDNFVVDATMKGNAARFINHSCDPNCYSKVVEIHGHKHIVIFALRRIQSGEELTYDYKFPFEEDKIPCTCGARKCRKFLN